jgi:glycosyltransferase involved in cell wall biosynthesis
VNITDLVVFTHSGYRDSMLLGRRRGRGHIIHASWIDRGMILSRAEAEALWRDKLSDPSRPLRAVFAANLLPSKGIAVMLDALRKLSRRGVPLSVDLYGHGVMLAECTRAARSLTGSVRLNICGTVGYGEPFFRMIQEDNVMLVPSLSDEQPRIIFDSFARPVPMISPATPPGSAIASATASTARSSRPATRPRWLRRSRAQAGIATISASTASTAFPSQRA